MSTPEPDRRFLDLLEGHKKILYKVAYAYCGAAEDRRDLMQEMVIQLWKSFGRFDGRVKFSTWMYRIAMNVAISSLRSEGRRIRDTVPIEESGLEIAAADDLMEAAGDNMRTLQQLIGRLDEMSRALLLLYLDGHGADEIAEIVGISPGNVAIRLTRLKQKLAREFQSAAQPQLETTP